MNADEDSWTLLEGTHDGKPVLIRARQFLSGIDKGSYPVRLNIFWQMRTPDANGLASTSESAALEVFEERLVRAVDHDSQSVLSLVLTGHGQREFVFHTADSSEFVRRLTQMPQEPERYPIEIRSHEDPEWEYDHDVTRQA